MGGIEQVWRGLGGVQHCAFIQTLDLVMILEFRERP